MKELDAEDPPLARDAQRFFVLTQTDNMWKEHLQVCNPAVHSRRYCLITLPPPCKVVISGSKRG